MIRQRFILAVHSCLGLLIITWMNSNLSVTIIQMVSHRQIKNITSKNCPFPSRNGSIGEVHLNGGQHKLDWSPQLQGVVLSAYYWGYLILIVPFGALAERYGGKRLFITGLLLSSVLTIVSPFIAETNVYFYLVVRILEGLGESAAYPSIITMLGKWCPQEENSIMMAIVITGAILGNYLGLTVAGALSASSLGWPSAFFISGSIGVLLSIPCFVFVYDCPQKHPWISKEEKDYILSSIISGQEETNEQPVPWKRILLSKYVWSYVIVSAIWGWSLYTLMICLPKFLSEVFHYNISSNGVIAGLPNLAYIVLMNVFPWLSEAIIRRGWIGKTNVRKLFTFISLGGTAVVFLGIRFAGCNRGLVIGLLMVCYAFLAASNAGFVPGSLDLSPEYAGIIFAMGFGATTISAVATPIVTNTVTQHGTQHEWNIIFYAASASSAVGCIFNLFSSAEYQNWNSDKLKE